MLHASRLVRAASLGAALVVGFSAGCKSTGQRALPYVQDEGDKALARGDYPMAVADFKEVVTRKPGYWRDRYKYAEALMGDGKPAEAREQMEMVFTIKPNRFDVLDLLARTQLASGDIDSMARLLRDEARAHGTARAWLRYGWFMAKAGDLDEGERALLESARLDEGKDIGPQLALAELYRVAGDQARELERLRMCYWLEPNNDEVIAEVKRLGRPIGPTFGIPPKELGYGQKPSSSRPSAEGNEAPIH